MRGVLPMDFDDDLDRLDACVARDPSFRRVAPERLSAEHRRLEVAATSDAETFALAAMRFMAVAGNGHTRAIPNAMAKIWPMRFVWLEEGPCLVGGHDRFGAPRGTVLLRINNLTPRELHRRFKPLLAGNPARQWTIGAMMLAWPSALRAITGWPENEPTTFELGSTKHESLTILAEPENLVEAIRWYPVHETGIVDSLTEPNRDGRRQHPGLKNFCKPWPESSAWYVRLGDFATDDAETVAHDLTAMRQLHIMTDRRRSIVIDLRGNPGGNFFGVTEFAERVNDLFAPDGVCLVLVDRFTFSAAIVAAALLKHNARRCRIIGEPMGDDTRFYAEGGTERLPRSGLLIRYSTAYHDWCDGIADPDYTPASIGRHLVAAGSLTPDTMATPGPQDVRSGRDPAVAAAKRILAALG